MTTVYPERSLLAFMSVSPLELQKKKESKKIFLFA